MNLKLNKGRIIRINHSRIEWAMDFDLPYSVTDSDEEVYQFTIDPFRGENEELELPFDTERLAEYLKALEFTFFTFGQSMLFIKSYRDIKEAVETLNARCVQSRAFKTVAETYINQIDLFLVHIFNDQILEDLVYHIEVNCSGYVWIEFKQEDFENYQISQDIKTDKAVGAHFEGSREVR